MREFLLSEFHHVVGLFPHHLRVGLLEGRVEHRRDSRPLGLRHHRREVLSEVSAAPLPGGIWQNIRHRGLDAQVGSAGDQIHLPQATGF